MGDDRLGRKEGAAVPLSEEELDPYLTLSPGPRPTSVPSGILIHLAVWSQQTMVENWGCVPLFLGGGSWDPSDTMWPGPRPTSMPSFILIHPVVWPQ